MIETNIRNASHGRRTSKSALTVVLVLISAAAAAGLIAAAALFGGGSAGSGRETKALTISGRPSFAGARLTAESAARKILPSIVGVIQYRGSSANETGEGSGVIMSSDGLIITNYHVISGAGRLEAVTRVGKRYPASVTGFDTRTDLAVIKINAKGLCRAEFGDSSGCRVGEAVIAAGNPSGMMLAGSVTQGIISALDRYVDIGSGPMKLIQTDAAINPGNSGGALVNMYGQVIAINSAKIAEDGYEGLGFSIPVGEAKPVIDSILRCGYVKGRVRIGLACRRMDASQAARGSLPAGICVERVEAGSSAEKCGILAGDIITSADGRNVTDAGSLITIRNRHRPGEIIYLNLYRPGSGEVLTVGVTLAEDRGAKDEVCGW